MPTRLVTPLWLLCDSPPARSSVADGLKLLVIGLPLASKLDIQASDVQPVGVAAKMGRLVNISQYFGWSHKAPFFMDSQGLGIADTFMVHIAASIRNATLPHGVLSYLYANHLFTGRMAVEDGHVELSDAPGLGIELDEETVERYRADRALS